MRYLILLLLITSCSTRKVNRTKVVDKTHATELSDLSYSKSIDSVKLSFIKNFVKKQLTTADSVKITDKGINIYGVKSKTKENNTITGDSLAYNKFDKKNNINIKDKLKDFKQVDKDVKKTSMPIWGWVLIAFFGYLIFEELKKRFKNKLK